tara:strand:- start:2576 stop:3271 length:696 start_codon:yes stop_codon:yes gene_type:complete
MPIPIYTIKNLHISKGDKFQLYIKQFDIYRGACYVFSGSMGSGKSTLLDTIYSQKKVDKGEIKFEEKNLQSYSKRNYKKNIAIVPQVLSVKWGTVENYIIKIIRSYSYIKNPDKRFKEIVKKMKIEKLLKRKVRSLTAGELRWVVLAANIAADSKVLFIDGYEQHLGKEDIQILNKIIYRKINYDGITLIASTRNKELFNKLASVTITLDNGRITSLRSFSKKREKYKKRK